MAAWGKMAAVVALVVALVAVAAAAKRPASLAPYGAWNERGSARESTREHTPRAGGGRD